MAARRTYADRLEAIGAARLGGEATDDPIAAPAGLLFGLTDNAATRRHLVKQDARAALCGVTIAADFQAIRWDVYTMFACPACLKVAETDAAEASFDGAQYGRDVYKNYEAWQARPIDVIGEVTNASAGNVIVRVGRAPDQSAPWEQIAHVVLTPDEARRFAAHLVRQADEGDL